MTNVTIIGAADSDTFDFGGFGVSWKFPGASTSGRFSVVHHPIAPRALGGL